MATEDDIDLDDLLDDALNDFEDEIETANAEKQLHITHEVFFATTISFTSLTVFESMQHDKKTQTKATSSNIQNVLERAYQEITETHDQDPTHDSVDKANKETLGGQARLDVESKVAETLKNMAKAAEEAGGLESTEMDHMGEEMMKEMLEGLGEMGVGDKDNFQSLVDNMMQQLLNKDVMYDPIKQICDKYPEWLAEKKSTISKEDYERYGKQYQHFQQIVAVYAEEPENYTKLSELMQES
ncbi:hypothetical protein ABG067_000790 [Albugo candida]